MCRSVGEVIVDAKLAGKLLLGGSAHGSPWVKAAEGGDWLKRVAFRAGSRGKPFAGRQFGAKLA